MADFVYRAVLIGIGATIIYDLWSLLLTYGLGIPRSNWGLVGRWFGHLPRGRFVHEDIAKAQPFPYERAFGWFCHYAVGVVFASALLIIAPPGWTAQPTLLPAMIVGLVTIGAGWFILQPGMGAGIASSKRSNATQIRARNIAGHIVFGLGLYATALLIR